MMQNVYVNSECQGHTAHQCRINIALLCTSTFCSTQIANKCRKYFFLLCTVNKTTFVLCVLKKSVNKYFLRKTLNDIAIFWATSWQNQHNCMCAQRRLRSAWSESSLWAQWVTKDPSFLHANSEDWSDWGDAQANLSIRWAHMRFCWFCHTLVFFILWYSLQNELALYTDERRYATQKISLI